jgi:hypothetical protein
MPTVRIVIEIEAGEATQTSVSLEQPQPSIRVTEKRAGAIEARVRRLVNEFGRNEKAVVKAVLEASAQGTKVYRKQLMPDLEFDQLLQFNGVLAWITRKYRKLVGEPDSWLVESVYDSDKDDYYLQIQPETPEDVIIALKASLELD